MTQCNETRPAGHVIEVCLRDTGHEGAHRYISDPPPDDVRDLRSKLTNLEAENGRYRGALTKISAIRDSIVGMQGFNFSEHAYPLVAALNAAGFEGAGYEISRANLGTLIEQRDKAEKERNEALAECERLKAELADRKNASAWCQQPAYECQDRDEAYKELTDELRIARPIVEAAKTWRHRECTGELKFCRETVDDHDRDCPFNTLEVALENAIDHALSAGKEGGE